MQDNEFIAMKEKYNATNENGKCNEQTLFWHCTTYTISIQW